MNLFDKYFVKLKLIYLPSLVSFDEKFINRKICNNSYAFVLVDCLNVKIPDIASSRHLDRLDSYFSKISPKLILYVKYITLNMYDTYLRIDNTLSTWKKYILISFIKIYDPYKKKHRSLSDGPIEGLNSQIQKI